ncbi:MAG: hydrogenase 3 maturation endopeptidase HyCI [Chloroflexi bacterium]|nr:hydrogenase 3 maturation endopeptidase HyCI [Chloroflexota bacterium]
MSKPPWQIALTDQLEALQSTGRQPRIAVIGIGNELMGDDAAGVVTVRQLSPLLEEVPHVCIIDGGGAPENHTGRLRELPPDLVILVDAAQLDAAPGTIQWLAWEATSGLSASTHTMPPYMLAKYLIQEFNCSVGLLGIQPAQVGVDLPISPPVSHAVGTLVQVLQQELSNF